MQSHCISIFVSIPHWNFATPAKWIAIPQFVSFPHWNFNTFYAWFVIPQIISIPPWNFIITANKLCFHNSVSIPPWNFTIATDLIVIPQLVSFPHWNFVIIANKLRFHNLSLFYTGISSSSPINCFFHNCLFSTLEIRRCRQLNCISTICLYSRWNFIILLILPMFQTFGVSLNFTAMKFNHFRGLSESYTVMPAVGLRTLVWFCNSDSESEFSPRAESICGQE